MLTKEKRDYEGFRTRPMQWETVVKKFEQLTQPYIPSSLQTQIEARGSEFGKSPHL